MEKQIDKIKLLNSATSLEFLSNLSRELGPKIYIKRDDESGRGTGGNKLRKYERIIADAVGKGSDTLIIAGHYQSNAARSLVEVACQLNLKSVVVCKEMIPKQNETFNNNGNSLLMKLMNANIISIKDEDDFQTEMENIASKLISEGKKPYIIPFGGSNLLGSLGYVDCANEILEQFKEEGSINPDFVVTPLGSGGTMAGLVAGFSKTETKVVGFSVLHKDETIEKVVKKLVTEINPQITNVNYTIDTNYVGKGYGNPTEEGIKAIKLLAELEGMFLCPVYTSKAMSGLVDYIKMNKIKKEDTVVFIHTGGMPLVYSYFNSYNFQ